MLLFHSACLNFVLPDGMVIEFSGYLNFWKTGDLSFQVFSCWTWVGGTCVVLQVGGSCPRLIFTLHLMSLLTAGENQSLLSYNI